MYKRQTPGSERWIAALQPTDADAMRLDKVDVASMSAEAAARLWAVSYTHLTLPTSDLV